MTLDLTLIVILIVISCIILAIQIKQLTQKGHVDTELVNQQNKNIENIFAHILQQDTERTRNHVTKEIIDLKSNFEQQSGKLKAEIKNQIFEDNDKMMNNSRLAFTEIRKLMDGKLDDINNKTQENIQTNFKQATSTFQAVLTRLAKMDEVQKEMQSLSSSVIALDDILSNNKTIGTFGEVQLQQVLEKVFGEESLHYKMQYTIDETKTRPDAVIFFPEPTGMVCLDSKFPLVSYRSYMDIGSRMVSSNSADAEKSQALQIPGITNEEAENKDSKFGIRKNHLKVREFESAIKKHIDDISGKYIVPSKTASYAIMFIPSEAIYLQIITHHYDLIDYAHSKNVYMASPTTLMAIANTVHAALMRIEMSKNAEIIKDHLIGLSTEFTRYSDRWNKLEKQIQTVSSTAKEINTTNDKIINKFQKIKDSKVLKSPITDINEIDISGNYDKDTRQDLLEDSESNNDMMF